MPMRANPNFTKLFAGSGAVTLFNALRAFVINKLLAIFLPPAAFACVGQFLNLMCIGQATSSLALQNGWTALTSQNKDNREKLMGVWRGGVRLTTFASLLTFVVALLFCFMAPLETLLRGNLVCFAGCFCDKHHYDYGRRHERSWRKSQVGAYQYRDFGMANAVGGVLLVYGALVGAFDYRYPVHCGRYFCNSDF